MGNFVMHVTDSATDELRQGIAKIQDEQHVSPEFPPEVEEAAKAAAANPRLPELDRTDIAFVTIDPESSMDLDQALFIERAGDGYTVYYAIADVAAFVTPGDPVDLEANRRGETLYGGDSKIPLHPKVLSEDAASLLPDQVRPALLWTIKVDSTGEGTDARVERALVRSREKLSYQGCQEQVDAGTAPEWLELLREVGELRIHKEAERGGISLPMPEQEVDIQGEQWELQFRTLQSVESWNAQISLLTGFAAASLMVYAQVGILRTLPPPEAGAIKRLHRAAKALHIEWPAEQTYADFIRALDPGKPNHAAMVVACTAILRGAGYVGFNGEVPAQPEHSALASEYAHVTAPLRRLVDRYAGEICVALTAGEPVPQWVLDKLGVLPETMQKSDRLAGAYESSVLNLVESLVLRDKVGQSFRGVVLGSDHDDPNKGTLQIEEPAVEASVTGPGPVPVGDEVEAKLVEADPATRVVRFELRHRAYDAELMKPAYETRPMRRGL